ncbi:hypothetical protein EVAR_34634_1 [Eumeta japonica]|uniref:Uncharacterized protein n=1 Tax=Eumeta variegata TaxID=151549 RepID=A0A4C1VEQ1_EUMVA|nr:hypothetical protein EVAR_34634_1 [Eumeta japonica]
MTEHSQGAKKQTPFYRCNNAVLLNENELRTYQEAMRHENASEWEETVSLFHYVSRSPTGSDPDKAAPPRGTLTFSRPAFVLHSQRVAVCNRALIAHGLEAARLGRENRGDRRAPCSGHSAMTSSS